MSFQPEFTITKFPPVSQNGILFTHPRTNQTYYYLGGEKMSWTLLSDVENRIYTGVTAPSELTENLRHGDLWWDSEHFELRVYHKVPIRTTNEGGVEQTEYSEGVWVSSTHPMMDPDDPDKMNQIGRQLISPPERTMVEGSEFKFTVLTPYSTVTLDDVDVSAVISPSYVGGEANQNDAMAQNTVLIEKNDRDEIAGVVTIGYYPPGGYDPTDPTFVRVTTTVEALKNQPDEYYEKWYQTQSIGSFASVIYPLPKVPPLVIDILPFNEQLSDTLALHVIDPAELEDELYTKVARKSFHTEPVVTGDEASTITLMSRIGEQSIYDETVYPFYSGAPVRKYLITGSQAKDVTLLFKYGNRNTEAPSYADKSNEHGTVRNTWQGVFEGQTVEDLINDYEINFFVDGEDERNWDDGQTKYTTPFEGSMGRVTNFRYDTGGGVTQQYTGEFIGVTLNARNMEALYTPDGGDTRRLYFAGINNRLPRQNNQNDIIETMKGYIDIVDIT